MSTDQSAANIASLESLSASDLDLCVMIALAEPSNITRATQLATAIGVRSSQTRAYSTSSLAQALEPLVQLGIVKKTEVAFSCPRRMRVLHAASIRGRLDWIVRACALQLFGPDDRRRFGNAIVQRLVFLTRAALAGATPDSSSLLSELASAVGESSVAELVLVPDLFLDFDSELFSKLQPILADRWLPLCLSVLECHDLPTEQVLNFFAGRPQLLQSEPNLVLPLAGIALLLARFGTASHLVEQAASDVRRAIAAAIAVIEGRYSEAASIAPRPQKGVSQGTGVVAVLNAFALLRSNDPEAAAYVARLMNAGTRKPSVFRFSHSLLKHIGQCLSSPDLTPPSVLSTDRIDPDGLSQWLYSLWALWFEREPKVLRHVLTASSERAKEARKLGRLWLEREMNAIVARIASTFDEQPDTAPIPEGLELCRPLCEWLERKEDWEQLIERLERVMPGQTPDVSDERVIWRVAPRRLLIEPYVQKRTGSNWTRGRKLAIKHLLPGANQPPKLAPEDKRVAVFAREERYGHYGYPEIVQTIAAEAFVALVGHPRVFIEDAETPIEVVAGHVQLVLRERGQQLEGSILPQDFRPPLTCVQEDGRLVVYTLPDAAQPVFREFVRGASFPLSAKERLLGVLKRGSHLLPVQTFDTAGSPAVEEEASTVAADPRPWLRITPNAEGLNVLLSVRPLGQHGPHATPGKGARTLIGQLDGETVSCQRDFGLEQAALARLLELSPSFESYQLAPQHFVVTDNVHALELLAALRDLGDGLHAEWPQGAPIRLRSRVARKALRGSVRAMGDFYLAAGTLQVDDELVLQLSELLELADSAPGRFVRLSNGDYVELEQSLRDALETLSASRAAGTRKPAEQGVALSKSALAALDVLDSDALGFSFDRDARAQKDRIEAAFRGKFSVPRGLAAELREYQREGFVWLARMAELGLSACLADDMGLGKTVQILALLLRRAKSGSALVIAPLSVCGNWRAEIERFAPSLQVRWFVGAARESALAELGPGCVVITSYNLLQQDSERLLPTRWSSVVLDEAQFIKNPESQRARAAYALDAQFKIVATGTPVENHVGDLFGLFHFLLPELLGSRVQFVRRFPTDAEGEVGLRARRALRLLLQPFILRRTKSQVLSELPAITEIVHRIELSTPEATLYEALRQRALTKLAAGSSKTSAAKGGGLDQQTRFQVLAEITRLRRLCCHPDLVRTSDDAGVGIASSKLAALLELVDELREGGHRALVFSQFVDVLALVRGALDERKIAYQYLDGSTPSARRTEAVNAFQAGEGELFLISLRAGGFGLNLTAADYVIHIDPWWNPAAEAQATDRAHRIGQSRPVTVYRLICVGTIEERIQELQRSKRELAASLLEDSDQAAKLSADQLKELLLGA